MLRSTFPDQSDATHMGCAEAKIHIFSLRYSSRSMQPTWDALRQSSAPFLAGLRSAMQPTWDALRQSIKWVDDDDGYMMQPTWDALRQRFNPINVLHWLKRCNPHGMR